MKRYVSSFLNMAIAAFFGWLLWRVSHRWELWVAGYLVFVHLVQLLQAAETIAHSMITPVPSQFREQPEGGCPATLGESARPN